MYIVNRHGILHSIPDDWRIPPASRDATKQEIEYFEKTGDAVAANAKPKAEAEAEKDKDAKPKPKAEKTKK